MTISTQPITLAAQHGNGSHVAYCGLCNQQALYVWPLQPGRTRPQRDHNGEILNLHPDPKGRWVDRGDGYYTELAKPPRDGHGRRAHRCKQ